MQVTDRHEKGRCVFSLYGGGSTLKDFRALAGTAFSQSRISELLGSELLINSHTGLSTSSCWTPASNKSHVIPTSESLPASAVSPVQGLRIPPSRPSTSCLCLWLHSGQSTCLLSIWRTERCSILTYTLDLPLKFYIYYPPHADCSD